MVYILGNAECSYSKLGYPQMARYNKPFAVTPCLKMSGEDWLGLFLVCPHG